MKVPVTRPNLVPFHRIGLHLARLISRTAPFERASLAIRILRHALQRSQFHHGLVVLPGMPRVHHQAGQFRKDLSPLGRIDRDVNRKQARKHPEDIPVHDRIRPAPYERNNGRRRILAYPLQRDHILIASGEYPPETFPLYPSPRHAGYGRGCSSRAPASISRPRLPPPKPAKPHPGTAR